MIYLVPEQENLFPTEVNSSPHVPLDFKSGTPTNGTSYASPKVGSFQSSSIGKINASSNDVKEDEVDVQLDKIDGRIPRKRDPQLYVTDLSQKIYPSVFVCLFRCHHNIHGKCIHCIPIEPYDEEFLKNRNPPIKHMSFRAYIRKLQSSSHSDR